MIEKETLNEKVATTRYFLLIVNFYLISVVIIAVA